MLTEKENRLYILNDYFCWFYDMEHVFLGEHGIVAKSITGAKIACRALCNRLVGEDFFDVEFVPFRSVVTSRPYVMGVGDWRKEVWQNAAKNDVEVHSHDFVDAGGNRFYAGVQFNMAIKDILERVYG